MKDKLGRKIDYMRISITDRCNLRCRYCMPDKFEALSHFDILTYEEIMTICKSAVKLGISRFKITGGEPLTRKNCSEFMADLKKMEGVEQVTITTNGLLLEPYLEEFKQIGIDGINVSLDSCSAEQFYNITGVDGFDKVMSAINKSVELGIKTKINCVPIKDYNDDNILKLIDLTKEKALDVRFIEVMPMGGGKDFAGINPQAIRQMIVDNYEVVKEITEIKGNGPASYIQIGGHLGSVGFINAIHNKFCNSCNRIRLTANGYLKTCLYYDSDINLRDLLRTNQADLIYGVLEQAILDKHSEHFFWENKAQSEQKIMAQIGG